MNKQQIIALLLLIITVIMWGVSFVSIQIVLPVLHPLNLIFYRLLVASIILYPLLRKVSPKEKLQKQDFARMFLTGVVGISIYFYLENSALTMISANVASVIVAFMPVASMLGEGIFQRKKIKKSAFFSALISIVGVYMVIGGDLSGPSEKKGYLYMLLAVLVFAIYLIGSKPLFHRYSDLGVSFYQSFFACIVLIPFIGLEKISWDLFRGEVAVHFFFLAIFCSALATYFYMYSLNHLGVTISAVFLNLIPVATFISSSIFFKVKPTLFQSLGGAVVILSVTAVTLLQREKEDVHPLPTL